MDENLERKIVHKFHVPGLCSLLLLVVLSSAAGGGKCLFLVLKTRLYVLDSKAEITTVYSCVFTCGLLRVIYLTFNITHVQFQFFCIFYLDLFRSKITEKRLSERKLCF